MKLFKKLAMAKSVPVASKKSTYRNVISAIQRLPLLKLLKLHAVKTQVPQADDLLFTQSKNNPTQTRASLFVGAIHNTHAKADL